MRFPKTKQKQVLVKSYTQLSALEIALKTVQEDGSNKFTISIIGNLGEVYANDPKGLAYKKKKLQSEFEVLLGTDTAFDTFYNPEMGCLFVTGFLVSLFLNPIGKKILGALTGGPYGVLRGLGVSEFSASLSIKNLNEGGYLLLVRGDSFDIEELEYILTIQKEQ